MSSDWNEARRVFEIEARAILELKDRSAESFTKAINLCLECKGKIVITGMGKSGIIARKIVSTLSSTGSPAIYVHPAESSHGDLGVIVKGDVVIAISYSGETSELNHIVNYIARKGIPLIAMTGKLKSALASAADVVLDVSVQEEACPLGLAPTASTTATLAMGDALAMALLQRRGFLSEHFAEYHPSGSLGARLLTRVKDVMHTGEAVAIVGRNDDMKSVISKMTSREVRGVAGVLDEAEQLIGVITDGNLRRRLDQSKNPLDEKASDIMSTSPKTVDLNEMAEKALFMMEQFAIQALFVVDRSTTTPKKPIGILHLQDLLKAKVR